MSHHTCLPARHKGQYFFTSVAEWWDAAAIETCAALPALTIVLWCTTSMVPSAVMLGMHPGPHRTNAMHAIICFQSSVLEQIKDALHLGHSHRHDHTHDVAPIAGTTATTREEERLGDRERQPVHREEETGEVCARPALHYHGSRIT